MLKCSCGGELVQQVQQIRFARAPFVCKECGKLTGFYNAMATNMFTVQPMPAGAMPFYLDHMFSSSSIEQSKP